MKTSMDSWLRTKSDYLHLGAEEIALCDFGDKLYSESVGNCAGLLRFLPSPKKKLD